jgi:putative NADH-flavin reductase
MHLTILGASGRTGRHVAREALRRGHEVTVLVRSADAFAPQAGLDMVVGDAMDAGSVARATAGTDAVISALGISRDKQPVCSTAMANLVTAGVDRVVSISGAGLDVPGDRKGLFDRFAGWLVRTVTPQAFEDKVREYEIVRDSAVRWTLVRPPQLVDGPGGKPVRSDASAPQGLRIDRRDLADFCLDVVEADRYGRAAPFVAT